jgi:predicted MarR family transcription regulator
LVRTEDLVLGGQPTLPQRGDWIEETDAERTYRYEVRPLGDEPCWRYSDSQRQTLRIHTQALGSEDAG